ncbi:MAG: pyridoxal phosphate-dependent aminotransferase [Acidimicrobiia bacterium]
MAITNRANELRASGEPVIGFGAGEPDFPTPTPIVEAAIEAAADPASHRYSPAAGQPRLREAIAHKTLRDSGLEVSSSQVVVSNGGKQAVYLTCQALLDPGDEVLLPAPYWVTYPEAISLAGAVPVVVPTDESTNFMASIDQLDAAVTDRTKMLVFVSPSNPTGSVATGDQVREIGEWAVRRGIWVMTDEIYEHLVYGDAVFSSVPVEAPAVAERCVIINGVAKTYAMTGWRVGWLIAPNAVATAASRMQSHISSNVNNVAQAAALAAVSGSLEASEQMLAAFDRRRMTMVKMLRSIDGVTCQEPGGAFYTFPNVSGLLGRPIHGRVAQTSLELASIVLEEAKVAFVPGEAFGAPGYARFSFALGDGDLVEGLERITELVSR